VPRRQQREPLTELVYRRGSTAEVIGTHSELRRRLNMARLKGTGKDPQGSYNEGVIFDVPANEALYNELIDKGYA